LQSNNHQNLKIAECHRLAPQETTHGVTCYTMQDK
jgi:hypothetical protein